MIDELLLWMEKHLNKEADFTKEEISHFFANHFVIHTNQKLVEATPQTYREYLYRLKSNLKQVVYEKETFYNFSEGVVAPFTIEMRFFDKKPLRLMALSLFFLNSEGKITKWKEVFSKEEAPLEYEK
jgi:hypothetical protein